MINIEHDELLKILIKHFDVKVEDELEILAQTNHPKRGIGRLPKLTRIVVVDKK